VALDDPQAVFHVAPDRLAAVAAGDTVTLLDGSNRYTYVPVAIDGTRRGALELSESLSAERRYVRTTLVDTALTTLALALVSAGLSVVLGVWLVGRPVRALADKARRIGRGDFAGPVRLDQNDELALLAGEMNAMCDRLVATLEQLRHSDRLTTVGKLASGVAHELGTPLNVVSARATMIATGEVKGGEAAEYARIVVDASDRMTKIIRQLLAFARRKTSQKALHDVGRLVRDTLELLRTIAKKKDVTLVFQEASDVPDAVDVDAGQLQQAITNLVVNAVQSMTAPGEVAVLVGRGRAAVPADLGGGERDCLSIAVQDHGSGVSQEDLAHVFEPFFTTKDVGEGTGLGLSVAYGIVREHQGWIDATSKVGEGSTFSIYIPLP
jgi:signal transduction histidine kinase